MSTESGAENAVGNISHHRWRKTGGVGINHNKQRIIGQNTGTELYKSVQILFQLPDLAGGAPAIGRRIHDDGIISSSPLDLPLHKLGAVIHDPADGLIVKPGNSGVVLCPGYHPLCRVNMTDAGSGSGTGNGGAAGIGKQVQHIDGPSRIADLVHAPIPVGCLFRENTGVFKIHGFDLKTEFLIANFPFFRQLFGVPLTAAGIAAGIAGIVFPPAVMIFGCLPDHLRVGTHQGILPPALQLFSSGAVQHLIVFPITCDPHALSPYWTLGAVVSGSSWSGSSSGAGASPSVWTGQTSLTGARVLHLASLYPVCFTR